MAAPGGFLAGVKDPWLKVRLLRAVVTERLPQPGAELPQAEVASVLEAVRTHGLLVESLPSGSPDPKLAEAWRAAVDAWVERVVELVDSDWTYSCWLGTLFLGLTVQECSNKRFAVSYSNWFEKILSNLQEPSGVQLISSVSCTSMRDLFARLAKFLNLKKEASSFAGRVVEPALRLLNGNASVAAEAVDLLTSVIMLYPSSVNRHYNKVESAIVAKVMSTEVVVKSSEKFSRALALLPSVRVSEDSWSLMIQKILIMVNYLLNDAFIGLEEEKKGHDIMMLLVPAGTNPPPTLGDQLRPGGNCDVDQSLSGSGSVKVPMRALIALIRRVLLVDGSLHKKLFPSTTSLHQELICFELPSLHSIFLDLLNATIKGMRSQLLPHAVSIIQLITEYFKMATFPNLRTKIYSIVQLLLTSTGIGTSMHLLQAIVSNAVADLNCSGANDTTIISTNASKVTSEPSSKSYSKKRKQEQQIQNSVVLSSEKAAISPKKMKGSYVSIASKEMTPETTGDVRMLTPLSVRIAALETLEILLNVGGALRVDHWRSEVDLLLINVATSACDTGGYYEQKPSTVEEPSISDLQLASLKALLASFLSSPHARPPYLARGIELFRRGKLEIDTKLAEFCSHAALALDVLVHPRALSLEKASPVGSGLNYNAPEKAVFGAGKSPFLPSTAMEAEDTYDDWLAPTKDEPAEAPVNDQAIGTNTAVTMSNDSRHLALITEDPKNVPLRNADAVQDFPASTTGDIKMEDADANEIAKSNKMDNPSSSNSVLAPPCTTKPDSQKHLLPSSPEQKPTEYVSHLGNKSPGVNASSSKPATSVEAPVVPVIAASSHQAPGVNSTMLTELFGSESSEDSFPGIVDADPDSDYSS
ncbi:hypothetical protein ACP70R_015471 [Stipagrostis hirtigluma subsp. patula]